MKIRMCQGVSGVIVVTTVTCYILVYHSSPGDRLFPTPALSTRSSVSPQRVEATPAIKSPALTLDVYTGVMDQKPLKMHCRTCALVSSSGQLIGSYRGEEIDRSECVIRMNDAPSRQYQQDVGRRTSVRVVAHSSLQRMMRNRQELINASQDTVFIFWGPSTTLRRDGKGHVYNNLRLLKQLLPRLEVYTISRRKMLKLDELFKKETGIDRKGSNSWLSTGWFTMAVAVDMCDHISVYGMVPPDFCRSSSHHAVPYHYYEPSGPDECSMYLFHERSRRGSHHRFITEKMVFAKWARTFNIHFYQPDWEPAAAAVFPGFNASYAAVAANGT